MDKEKIRVIIWYTAVILDAIEIIWGAYIGCAYTAYHGASGKSGFL